jgi:type 1 glutamine amidotransferase
MCAAAIDAYLVCGGRYHDIDYARLQLLGLLAEQERIRTRVAENYADVEAIEASSFLVTYLVDVVPDDASSRRLRSYVETGHRWLALHGTNSLLRYVKGRGWEAPREAQLHMETLGSQFIAHPPIAPYRVEVTQPAHPLVAGIGAFDADDELYLSELHPPLDVLLHANWSGHTPGFAESDWSRDEPRPVMYLKHHGNGAVLYLTLGHARGRHDMRPLMEEYPQIERGSWSKPAFIELLRRAIRWAARID